MSLPVPELGTAIWKMSHCDWNRVRPKTADSEFESLQVAVWECGLGQVDPNLWVLFPLPAAAISFPPGSSSAEATFAGWARSP
jgi:hypothetical protein